MTRHDAGIIDADAVREAAKKAGLTLTQLSAMCGKSDSWLSMVLTYSAKGKQSSIGIIQLISDALGVHVDAIVDRWIDTEYTAAKPEPLAPVTVAEEPEPEPEPEPETEPVEEERTQTPVRDGLILLSEQDSGILLAALRQYTEKLTYNDMQTDNDSFESLRRTIRLYDRIESAMGGGI